MNHYYIDYQARIKLEILYNNGESLPTIAKSLGVHLATIYRELARGSTGEMDKNGREGYKASIAQHTVLEAFKRRGRKKKEVSA